MKASALGHALCLFYQFEGLCILMVTAKFSVNHWILGGYIQSGQTLSCRLHQNPQLLSKDSTRSLARLASRDTGCPKAGCVLLWAGCGKVLKSISGIATKPN